MSLVFNYIKKYHPHICILQETHLIGSRTLALKKPWVGSYYHSTYSTYSRGVSVLIHKSLPFTLLDLHLDPEGKYVVLHAMCDRMELVLVGLYNLPPTSLAVLHKLTPILAQYPTAAVLMAGDFNITPNPSMDKLGNDVATESPLSRWADEYGFSDVWRWRYPRDRKYTCHSSTYASFSRIDLFYANGSLLPRIQGVEILPRGISDHAPLLMRLNTNLPVGNSLWRLSGFWITDERVAPEAAGEMDAYWVVNRGTAPPPMLWDAFKAYTRGQYSTIISKVRKDNKLALEEAESQAQSLESSYVANKDAVTYAALQTLQREISVLRANATRKILLS